LGLFLICCFGWLFYLWLTFKINDGANWARIVYLVLFLLDIISFVHSLLDLFSLSLILDILVLAGFGLRAAAFIMLFSPGAQSWFRPAAAHPPAD
jgi:hypothetical protein